MELLQGIFGVEGRVNRYTYWVNLLICLAANVILSQMFVRRYVSFYDFQEHTYITNKPIYFTAVFLIGLRALSISVRRWHDLDKSGWLAALNLFVIVNSAELIDLPDGIYWVGLLLTAVISLAILGFQGFVPGDQEPNQYGPPPKEGVTWVVPSSQNTDQLVTARAAYGSPQAKTHQVHPGTRAANALTVTATSSVNPGTRGTEIGSALGAEQALAKDAQQPASGVTSAELTTSVTRGQVWLGSSAPSLDVCVIEEEPKVSNSIYHRVRSLTLAQLNRHGMGIGRIITNTRSDSRMLFEANVVPAGDVTLTRVQQTPISSASQESAQQCVHLAFSDLNVPRDTVNTMLLAIATNLQKEFMFLLPIDEISSPSENSNGQITPA
ncbi:MAG: DUF805 domain-containing protein [Thermomicrobiales bacterium]|nr:DUF805 domain-containing protein [Thermomicrobiales bacterium]